MEGPDDKFEVFLRQFRPVQPGPLPTERRSRALAIAVVLLVATAIPAWFAWTRFADGARPADAVPGLSVPMRGSNPRPAIEPSRSVGGRSSQGVRRVRVGEDDNVKAPLKIKDARPVYPREAQDA